MSQDVRNQDVRNQETSVKREASLRNEASMSQVSQVSQVSIETLREQLRELSLTHAADIVSQELSEAVKHQRALPQVLHRLLSEELRVREEKRIQASLRLSGLPPGMSLANNVIPHPLFPGDKLS